MDTLELQKHMKKIHPSLENNVYAANRLPMYTHVPTYIICNLDADDKPGSHWVAIHIDTDGIGQYFDSYGRTPERYHLQFLKRNCKRWDWNVDRIQNDWTSVCVLEESLRYIAVKPTASTSVLRQKVWHLLNLPDFCEEIIVLKSNQDVVVPLFELRKGNDPQHPYILEVYPPGNRMQASPVVHNNMLTMGNGDDQSEYANRIKSTETIFENVRQDNKDDKLCGCTCFSQSTLSNETMALNKLRLPDNQMPAHHSMLSGFKKSDLSCRISSTSMFKLSGRKSRDNFANILLKIQGDLSTLSNKLSVLEKKLPSA